MIMLEKITDEQDDFIAPNKKKELAKPVPFSSSARRDSNILKVAFRSSLH